MRWLLGDYSDEGGRKGRLASNRAYKNLVSQRRFLAFTLVVIVVPTLLVVKVVLPYVLGLLGMTGRTLPYTIGLAIICFLVWPWSAWTYRFLYTRATREALRRMGDDLCVECGYRLEAVRPNATVCPECGTAIPIEVESPES